MNSPRFYDLGVFMTSNFKKELQKALGESVLLDEAHRTVYAVDASIYSIKPLAIVTPKRVEDVQIAVQIAARHSIPITARGAATGITGGCLGAGLVLDFSCFMNKILDINLKNKTVLCESGVIQDSLNEALRPHGFRLGPDTSTGNVATLGGMLANNSAGAKSLLFGSMLDHIEEVEVVLADGTLVTYNKESKLPALEKIKETYGKEIESHFPRLARSSSGYSLRALLDSPINPAKLFAASEGTLGVVTKLTLRIVPLPPKSHIYLIAYSSVTAALSAVPELLHHHPYSLELIDDKVIDGGRRSPKLKSRMHWLKGNPKALLALELPIEKAIQGATLLKSPSEESDFWALRKGGLGVLLSKRAYSRGIGFIEDISVDPKNLGPFMEELVAYLKSMGKEAGIYGHAGSGCMHIRPYIDLRSEKEQELLLTIQEYITDLLLKYGGVLSGEHGDGLIRSWLNPKLFGKKLYEAHLLVKKAFDPENLMNPGKIVHGKSPLKNLRKPALKEPETFLDFSKVGGLALSVDLCNGNGLCRKKEGLMCPSYQATGSEFDTTRARATALREYALQPTSEVLDVLDLCLQCKGCKTECPSQVDLAKMKAEMLYQVQKKEGTPLRSLLFAHVGELSHFFFPMRALYNLLLKLPFGPLFGITPHRHLPPLAKLRFSENVPPQPDLSKKVVLLSDTFTEFHCPEVGFAAIKVLNQMGFTAIVPTWSCCGRPALSKGVLPKAKRQAEALIASLEPYKSLPIIGLEPSCLLTLVDEFSTSHSLTCLTFDQFLAQNPLPPLYNPCPILVHGHCHQKALIGMQPTLQVLRAIGGAQVTEIPSGCCGLAGSFGYEKEHYKLSMDIGELALFPAVRKNPEALILASGFSCRCQIQHGTSCRPLHLAELIEKSLVKPKY